MEILVRSDGIHGVEIIASLTRCPFLPTMETINSPATGYDHQFSDRCIWQIVDTMRQPELSRPQYSGEQRTHVKPEGRRRGH